MTQNEKGNNNEKSENTKLQKSENENICILCQNS
jgi:hypothetical protein